MTQEIVDILREQNKIDLATDFGNLIDQSESE
jgi:hypothetical protein